MRQRGLTLLSILVWLVQREQRCVSKERVTMIDSCACLQVLGFYLTLETISVRVRTSASRTIGQSCSKGCGRQCRVLAVLSIPPEWTSSRKKLKARSYMLVDILLQATPATSTPLQALYYVIGIAFLVLFSYHWKNEKISLTTD